jgi:hypothetical protein
MKMHSGLTRITAAAVMSTFVPAVTLTSVFVPAGTVAVAATTTAPNTASAFVAGLVTLPLSGGRTVQTPFNGLLKITKFQVVNGALTAIGTFSGTYTDVNGNTQTVTNHAASVPVSSVDPSCSILDLTLGPLHLDLLGLVVDLNQVHLTITADEAPGALLGNLLCAVANLLNGGGPLSTLLTTLTNDLNAILAAL